MFECKNERKDDKKCMKWSRITYFYVIYYYYNILIINTLTTFLQFSVLKTLLNVACGMWHVAKLCFFLKWLLIDYCFVDTILDVNCVGGKQKVPASTKMELLRAKSCIIFPLDMSNIWCKDL